MGRDEMGLDEKSLELMSNFGPADKPIRSACDGNPLLFLALVHVQRRRRMVVLTFLPPVSWIMIVSQLSASASFRTTMASTSSRSIVRYQFPTFDSLMSTSADGFLLWSRSNTMINLEMTDANKHQAKPKESSGLSFLLRV